MSVTGQQAFLLLHIALAIIFVHCLLGGFSTIFRTHLTRGWVRVRNVSLVAMAAVAWTTTVVGTWFVYPGYRAKPDPGANLDRYPQAALEAHHNTAMWHEFGMEWKEHIGWLTPFLATAIAFVFIRYSDLLSRDRRLRNTVATLFVFTIAATVVAAGLGAVINKVAPNDFLGGIT
jgi:hypothetical protein